jgi:hypothetical protein
LPGGSGDLTIHGRLLTRVCSIASRIVFGDAIQPGLLALLRIAFPLIDLPLALIGDPLAFVGRALARIGDTFAPVCHPLPRIGITLEARNHMLAPDQVTFSSFERFVA